MNKYIIILAFLTSFYCFSQEEVISIKNDLKTSIDELDRTFASVNESNGDFSVYLEDFDSVYGYLFNSKYEKIGSLKTTALSAKYEMFLGSTVKNSIHYTYFSNNKNKKFSIQSFDFENKQAETKEIDLPLKKEKFLQSFTYNNTFYILSIIKNQSLINLYEFDKFDYSKKTINLSEISSLKSQNQKTTLHQLLHKDDGISKIEYGIPSALTDAFKYSKLYLKNNKIIITLDHRFQFTEIISIDLDDYSHTSEIVNQNQEDNATIIFKKSNSFLVENTLFQASVINEKFVFSIKDLTSKETLKEYSFIRDEKLSFNNKNEAIDKKEKKRTKRFIRRATNGIVGINLNKYNNDYHIELGSYRIVSSSGYMMTTPAMGSFSINGAGSVVFTPGTPSFAFATYGSNAGVDSNTIEVVLDGNFEFKSEELNDNVFDKIETFKKNEEFDFMNIEQIFKHKNTILYFEARESGSKFSIRKFNN